MTAHREGEARIPLLDEADMTEAQRAFYRSVISGPRGRMIGPLRAAIHSPELAPLWSDLGAFLRYRTCLPAHLNELAILLIGRRWTSQVEWWVHARVAAEAGLAQPIIDAIRDLRSPDFADKAEWEVYEFVRLLQQTGHVPGPLHEAIRTRWGLRGVVELTAVAGYYTMVAMTLNAHCIPVPDPHVPLAEADGLLALPAANLTGEQP